jgi:hypothetical protein
VAYRINARKQPKADQPHTLMTAEVFIETKPVPCGCHNRDTLSYSLNKECCHITRSTRMYTALLEITAPCLEANTEFLEVPMVGMLGVRTINFQLPRVAHQNKTLWVCQTTLFQMQ